MLTEHPKNFHTQLLFIALSLMMSALTATGNAGLEVFGLYSSAVDKGEAWRLITSNLVHFGWTHTIMNTAAFLLCGYAFFSGYSVWKFLGLFLTCCISVGMGIYFFNPHYAPYAGLSGAIHGLIAAGLLLTREYPGWLRWSAGFLFLGKLFHENTGYFDTTDLQNLIGAQVAVEAHCYGALGGLVFIASTKILELVKH